MTPWKLHNLMWARITILWCWMATRGHPRPAHRPSLVLGSYQGTRTSRWISVHRLLAPNSTEPIGKILHEWMGQSRIFMAQLLKKKKEEQKIYIPRRPSGRSAAAPAIYSHAPQVPAQPVLDPLLDSPPPSMSPVPPHEQDSSLEPLGRTRFPDPEPQGTYSHESRGPGQWLLWWTPELNTPW